VCVSAAALTVVPLQVPGGTLVAIGFSLLNFFSRGKKKNKKPTLNCPFVLFLGGSPFLFLTFLPSFPHSLSHKNIK
jgi:hypothetical protein